MVSAVSREKNKELVIQNVVVKEKVNKSDRFCYICSLGGNVRDKKCSWQEHFGGFQEDLYSLLPLGFPMRSESMQRHHYRALRFSAYDYFSSKSDGTGNRGFSWNEKPPLPPCVELRLKYWFSDREERFRKY